MAIATDSTPAFDAAGGVAPLPSGRGEAISALPGRKPWQRWQLGTLAALAVAACGGLLVLVQLLAALPSIEASWTADTDGSIVLERSPLPALQALSGARLQGLAPVGGDVVAVDTLWFVTVPRWALGDARAARWRAAQRQLSVLLQRDGLQLRFHGERQVTLQPQPRGYRGLGPLFWLTAGAALSLCLVAATMLLVRSDLRNGLFAAMAAAQSLNLLLLGIALMPGPGLPPWLVAISPGAQMALDGITAAAFVHSVTLFPLRLPAGRRIAGGTWLVMLLVLALSASSSLRNAWAWTQSGVIGCGWLVIGLLSWAYRIEPNPHAVLMRRVALAVQATSMLLACAVLTAQWRGMPSQPTFAVTALVWYLFLAAVLMLLPFLSRARPKSYELAMLAGVCALAASLHLLLCAMTTIGPFASVSLSFVVALLFYLYARQWLLEPTSRTGVLGGERMFESIHRTVREVEAKPQQSAHLLTNLLREMFNPLQARALAQRPTRSLVIDDGAALLVPVPSIEQDPSGEVQSSVLLRFANRGRHMFTLEDARLTDGVVEQLRRAVAYDKAVERGRSEERARIAQDLHDDIGARLLTLMYKAQSAEMEDYLRHTLKDLKTLTRGLAANDQRLSHATAEWKSDIAQRLGAAQIELSWSFVYDRDVVLSVVQWSALTRVLRELVSNAIQHSCATHVDIAASLDTGRMRLSFADDGIGRNPQAWSHGLGLGGVRKRVKLLGGDVQWAENGQAGVVCTVLIAELDTRR